MVPQDCSGVEDQLMIAELRLYKKEKKTNRTDHVLFEVLADLVGLS